MVEQKQNNDKPVYKNRQGSVEISVWLNESKNSEGEIVKFHNVKLSRNYKDKDGQWKESSSLGQYDLLQAAHLLIEANKVLNQKASYSDGFDSVQL